MRRIAIGAALVGGFVLLARALAPKLYARMMAACKGMFEQTPRQTLDSIEEIRANTTRMLQLLEARTQAEDAPQEEPLRTTAEEVEMVPA